MPRPKSILWVDDEVESLTSHILFLEEQGFAVETSTHGDDALVLLQRQPYGVVLLDEQMPGRRGLELFQAIRAIDHGMPVVMVTKSEEPETLKDAIGAEISDYLIKPVNPRQILSVVTRLLEGDRIRQQRLSRDFATRFRELEARRGGPLAWREWIELVVELAEWEVRLGQADEPGLQDALRTLQDSLRQDFARYLQRNYAELAARRRQRPAAALGGHRRRVPAAGARPARPGHAGRGGLPPARPVGHDPPADQRRASTSRRRTTSPSCRPPRRSPATPSSAGSFPAEIKARYPQWWDEHEDASLNAHEAELLTEQHARAHRAAGSGALREGLHCRRRRRPAEAAAGAPGAGRRHGAGLQLHRPAHPRADRELDPVRGRAGHVALRNLTRTWFERSPLWDALREAERRGVPVLLTTDHGSIHCHTPATVFAKRDTTSNLRYKFGDDLRAQDPESALVVDDLPSFGLPARTPGTRLLLATGDRFFVYPTKLREYQARYRGAFLHGGVSPEEVLLPIALLTPRQG